MDDEAIIGLYWARSEEAIRRTAEKYGGYCGQIIRRVLGDGRDAEECLSDTWLGAWSSIPPRRPNCLSVYLGKITRNLSLNRARSYTAQKRGLGQTDLVLSELEDCIPADNDVEQILDEMILTRSINQFLRAQPRQKRNIFIRRYWYLYPIRNIAAAYGMSESKVASLLFRMRNELKSCLEKEGITL